MMSFFKKYWLPAVLDTLKIGINTLFLSCLSGFGFTLGVALAFWYMKG